MSAQLGGTRWLATLSQQPVIRRIRRVASGQRADVLMLALAAAVGLVTGLMAVALIELSVVVQSVAFGGDPGRLRIVLVPAIGGLVVGALCRWWMPSARGGGITDVLETVAIRGGRMRPDLAPAKLLASAMSIGVGASGGREAPVVQIAASVASTAGRLLALSEEQKRALIAAAAAAGIGAVFNAPIGGMLFSIEVIVGRFRLRYLHTIVVASVVASVTARELLGDELVFGAPAYGLGEPVELALYALVGLVAVPVGLGLGRGEYEVTRFVDRLPIHPVWATGLGGLLVGLIALVLPEVLGTGEHLPPIAGVREPVAAILQGELAAAFGATGIAAAGLLAAVAVAKMAATLISIGTGFAVGSFGPAFFLGAATGGAVGHLAAAVAPGAAVPPGALALVGMAAALAVSARAPLAGVLIVFELTGDYGLVLPLMLAVGLAMVLGEWIDPVAPHLLPLHARGIVYGEPEDVDVTQTVRVAEVMTTEPEVVPSHLPVSELLDRFRRTQLHGYPVVDDDGRLLGMVTLRDLAAVAGRSLDTLSHEDVEGLTVADICTTGPITVTPSDAVYRALRRMAELDIGRIPVVSEQDHGRLVGLVRRSDVLTAYRYALARSVDQQQRDTSSRLRDLIGTELVQAHVARGAPVCNRPVREGDWPPGTILVSLVRDGAVITPNGDTELLPGDAVTALTGTDTTAEVRHQLTGDERGE